jgi:hypothetical protein
MDLLEKWGRRADALVACLTAACAVALAVIGLRSIALSEYLMPFLPMFLFLELMWAAWIFHSLIHVLRDGHFAHAAWHVAVALPLAFMGTLSLSCLPQYTYIYQSPFLFDRIIQHLALSLHWWLTH